MIPQPQPTLPHTHTHAHGWASRGPRPPQPPHTDIPRGPSHPPLTPAPTHTCVLSTLSTLPQGQSIDLRPVVRNACQEERRTHCSQVRRAPNPSRLTPPFVGFRLLHGLLGEQPRVRRHKACRCRWPLRAVAAAVSSAGAAAAVTPLPAEAPAHAVASGPPSCYPPLSRCAPGGPTCSTACCRRPPVAQTLAQAAWRPWTHCRSGECWTGAQARPRWLFPLS